jgi:catechol 2,3-dioxygenase-like lactoylglutathione lyase family enzyme
MPLTKMEHYLVLTDDIEASKDFYCRVLGMMEGFRPPLDFPGYWLYLADIPCIHIADWDSYAHYSNQVGIPVSKRAPGTGPLDHIAFNGTAYEELTERLNACGVMYEQNIVPGVGVRQVFLNDPNGVKIELNFMPESHA